MVMVVIVPIRSVSEESIVIELLLKLIQIESGVATQVTLVAVPAGFVIIVGSASFRGVPI
jgi:hypothetical protein